MKQLKKYWIVVVICLVQIISITLDAREVTEWEWYYVYSPLLFIGAALVITPYVVLSIHYYNTKD